MSYKPCPFCDSNDLRIVDYGIECRNCGVWMGDGTRRRTIGKTLLDSWNHRANKEITHLKGRIEQLEKEKANLYDRCLENEEAMYDAVANGSDNQMILLVTRRDKIG